MRLPESWSPAGTAAEVTATLTRPHDAPWERLVRGQRVTVHGREWRVTDAHTAPDSGETYDLLPAEAVDEAERAARLRP